MQELELIKRTRKEIFQSILKVPNDTSGWEEERKIDHKAWLRGWRDCCDYLLRELGQ